MLAKLDPTAKVYRDLPLEKAMIISYLNGEAMHLEYHYASADMPEQRLDYLIASTLFFNFTSVEFNVDASKEIKMLATRPDGHLASRTYQTYFDILDRSSKGLSIEASLQKAEELFELRARDAFYSGGDQTEGGGEDNKIVRDYRLAAILKKAGHHFELK